jgi:hypothetical protein
MLLYFEFEDKRRRAEVTWPKADESIVAHILEKELVAEFPADLYYRFDDCNKVVFDVEDRDNERLLDLQNVIRRRLQEFANK